MIAFERQLHYVQMLMSYCHPYREPRQDFAIFLPVSHIKLFIGQYRPLFRFTTLETAPFTISAKKYHSNSTLAST
jgi:hypothetical protein